MARTRIIGDFPFFVPHASIAGTAFPLALVKKWYYLVRSWELRFMVSGTLTAVQTIPASGGPDLVIPVSLEVASANQTTVFDRRGIADGTGLTDETCLIAGPAAGAIYYYDIVGGSAVASATASGTNPDGTPFYSQAQVGPTANSDFSLFATRHVTYALAQGQPVPVYTSQAPLLFDPDRNLYRPSLELDTSAGAEALAIFRPGYAIALTVGTPGRFQDEVNVFNPITAVSIPVTVDGQDFGTVPGYYQIYNNNLSSINLTDFTYEIVVTPSRYWSYEGLDEIPLYDTTTGLPSTNPATGNPFTLPELVAMPVP